MTPRLPTDRAPLLALLDGAELVKQGAEAVRMGAGGPSDLPQKVYRAPLVVGGPPCLLKHRFAKAYRHATLDKQLTRSRLTHEARCLVRCLRHGVSVPGVRAADPDAGVLALEWIDGRTVREVLGAGAEGVDDEDETHLAAGLDGLAVDEHRLMELIGAEIAKLHLADIVHGDLTTSNLMARRDPAGLAVVLIDFGLASVSTLIEDKAVDLYVLERALQATHPEPEDLDSSETRFARILAAYAAGLGPQQWTRVQGRLDDVRRRGRKRDMTG